MELNKSLLDCMRAVRRRLREEQALDIHFQQRDAIAAMQAACARSGDATTRSWDSASAGSAGSRCRRRNLPVARAGAEPTIRRPLRG